MSEKKLLVKALLKAQATTVQCKMAGILLAVNGLENALAFVLKIQEVHPTDDKEQLWLL
jgi:hypothetical protein